MAEILLENAAQHATKFYSLYIYPFFYLSRNSFDVRGKSMSDATEWSDSTVFGSRAKFITQSEPAFLEIDVS